MKRGERHTKSGQARADRLVTDVLLLLEQISDISERGQRAVAQLDMELRSFKPTGIRPSANAKDGGAQ